jgi:hypothetical protein
MKGVAWIEIVPCMGWSEYVNEGERSKNDLNATG